MITLLSGTLQSKTPPYLVIDVNGVGYEIQAPMTTFYQLPAEQKRITLHTHLAIREDTHQLYGFAQQKDRDLFRILIKANGVGPKLALGILSGIESHELVLAIQQNDSSSLVRIPGVGKKTAQRLTIECQDAIKKLGNFDINASDTQQEVIDSSVTDAIQALTTLGYKEAEAKKSVEKIYQAGQTTQEMIRHALQEMAGA